MLGKVSAARIDTSPPTFFETVPPDSREASEALLAGIEASRVPAGTMTACFVEEIRQAARDLGLARLPVGLEPMVSALAVDRAGPGSER